MIQFENALWSCMWSGIIAFLLIRGGLWLRKRSEERTPGWLKSYESMVSMGMFGVALLVVAMGCLALFSFLGLFS